MEGKLGRRGRRLLQSGRRLIVAGLVVPMTIVTLAPPAHADDLDLDDITVTLVQTSPDPSVGNQVRYEATARNDDEASPRSLIFKDTVTAGAVVKSVKKISGSAPWSCPTAPGTTTSMQCTLGTSRMAAFEVDKFEIIVQAPNSPGTMTDTAAVKYGSTTISSASDTSNVSAGPSSGGGTFSGYCPPGGCTISSGTYPGTYGTTKVPTQANWTFPTGGFNFTFDLQTGNTCLPVVPCDGWTSGAATVPPGFGSGNPIILTMLYDPTQLTLPAASSPQSFKSSTYSPSDNGHSIPTCTGTATDCQQESGIDLGGAKYVKIRLSSGDPRVGNFYFPP